MSKYPKRGSAKEARAIQHKKIEKLRFDSDTQSMVEDLWIKQNEIIDELNARKFPLYIIKKND